MKVLSIWSAAAFFPAGPPFVHCCCLEVTIQTLWDARGRCWSQGRQQSWEETLTSSGSVRENEPLDFQWVFSNTIDNLSIRDRTLQPLKLSHDNRNIMWGWALEVCGRKTQLKWTPAARSSPFPSGICHWNRSTPELLPQPRRQQSRNQRPWQYQEA